MANDYKYVKKSRAKKTRVELLLEPELAERFKAVLPGVSHAERVERLCELWERQERTATGLTVLENEQAIAELQDLNDFDPDKPQKTSHVQKLPDKPKPKPVSSSGKKKRGGRSGGIPSLGIEQKEFKAKVDARARAIFKAKYGDMSTNNLETIEPAKTAFENHKALFSRNKKVPPSERGLRHPKESPMMGNVIALGLVPVNLDELAAMSIEDRRQLQWELSLKYAPKVKD